MWHRVVVGWGKVMMTLMVAFSLSLSHSKSIQRSALGTASQGGSKIASALMWRVYRHRINWYLQDNWMRSNEFQNSWWISTIISTTIGWPRSWATQISICRWWHTHTHRLCFVSKYRSGPATRQDVVVMTFGGGRCLVLSPKTVDNDVRLYSQLLRQTLLSQQSNIIVRLKGARAWIFFSSLRNYAVEWYHTTDEKRYSWARFWNASMGFREWWSIRRISFVMHTWQLLLLHFEALLFVSCKWIRGVCIEYLIKRWIRTFSMFNRFSVKPIIE